MSDFSPQQGGLAVGDRVVVTGASGFLGRHLVGRLRAAGVEVATPSRGEGFDLLNDQLPLDGATHVFHLAAETGVPDSWQDPARFHLVNTHGTVRVLDQCRRAGCAMTYVGAYIYGVPQHLPIDETHPVNANNPYAYSKWMGEQACEWYADMYSMGVTAIRLFNTYGPGQSNRFLIPRIVEQVIDPTVERIELMDLAPRRDYLYVDDAVDALLAARGLPGYRLYNVGSGVSHSISDVLESAMRQAGIRKEVVDLQQVRPNEIPDVRADCSRIGRECGWRPRFSLDEGIERMLEEVRK
ncbi:NAD-dependent epimerase/dehydratase family protein [Lysobacter gummosus]|jgi:nucleoside-diphosphate-sugar epimerase|uniref:NAD(P)-dependent oxidoreductase n=1 Tax=Lysobacter gummosus TaxID=262324 RepID=A0ABY3X7T5_9GAMM|nr:NAD(P)-dependent oxidoreductase [Lysobacter gummosus]ALN93115.1 NAD dependent epimerase/dehydratase family protein [Lysobacter gummosus]UNP28624.1 NAD(P)-dependent oxidoreductase [Lysobacter gummosus]